MAAGCIYSSDSFLQSHNNLLGIINSRNFTFSSLQVIINNKDSSHIKHKSGIILFVFFKKKIAYFLFTQAALQISHHSDNYTELPLST